MRDEFGSTAPVHLDPYAKGSVMSCLDEAQIPRLADDGRRLLQAERVALLAQQRDTARAHIPRPSAAVPRCVLEPLSAREIAHVSEWGHADTGVRP